MYNRYPGKAASEELGAQLLVYDSRIDIVLMKTHKHRLLRYVALCQDYVYSRGRAFLAKTALAKDRPAEVLARLNTAS